MKRARGAADGPSKRPTQGKIARRAGLDVSSVNKILNRRPGSSFSPKTVRRVFRVARELGYDLGRLKHFHRREFPRKEVGFRAALRLFLEDGTLHDEGTATIRELSLSGARLADIVLSRAALPILPFSVILVPLEGPLESAQLPGRVLRLIYSGVWALTVRFSELPSPTLVRLGKVVGLK
jgi:transcriptional regulator with XRE-family HTH domain